MTVTAYARRQPRQSNTWPGFVDAFASLLMVLMFVLLVFFLAQIFLTHALSGRDAALEAMRSRVEELAELLSLERRISGDLRGNLAQLSADLQASLAARDGLAERARLARDRADTAEAGLAELERRLAAAGTAAATERRALAAQVERANDLAREVAALLALKDELEREVAALARRADDAQSTLLVERRAAESARAQIALLNQQLTALRDQIAALNEALGASERKASEQNDQIKALGERLNAALAGRVLELARYRSEFFGRLREVLGDHPDIRIVGDRFVFQSEVLFDTASAKLDDRGRTQLERVAETLAALAAEIPPDLPWIVQVNGHTDRRPIRGERFASNWELSQARALSVVELLARTGVPPARLSAAGFGEFQPLDGADDEAAYRRNRRIELKLTQP